MQGKILIDQFFANIIVRCPCGAPKAIMVPVVGPVSGGALCETCGMSFTVRAIDFDRDRSEAEGQLRLRVVGKPSAIVRLAPGVSRLSSPSRDLVVVDE